MPVVWRLHYCKYKNTFMLINLTIVLFSNIKTSNKQCLTVEWNINLVSTGWTVQRRPSKIDFIKWLLCWSFLKKKKQGVFNMKYLQITKIAKPNINDIVCSVKNLRVLQVVKMTDTTSKKWQLKKITPVYVS